MLTISLISLKLTNETLIKMYLHVMDFFSFAIAQVIFKNLTRDLFDIFIIILIIYHFSLSKKNFCHRAYFSISRNYSR